MALVIHTSISSFLILQSMPPPLDPSRIPPAKTELPPPRLWSFKTEAVDELVKELAAEKSKFETEKKTIVTVQAQIAAEKAEVEKMRAEIKAMQEEIEQRVVAIQEDELVNLKELSQAYSAMNPAAAVAILREMDENMVVKILSMMKTPQVSALLGEMGKSTDKAVAGEDTMPKRAARISDKLRLAKPNKKPVQTAAN